MATLPNSTLLSVERKRARDRRAQRNLRHRKNDRIAKLESELSACREQMLSYQAHIRGLENMCTHLREQNLRLLERHPPKKLDGCSSQRADFQDTTLHLQPSHSMNLAHDIRYHFSGAVTYSISTRQAAKATRSFDSNGQSSADEAGRAFPSTTQSLPQDTTVLLWRHTPPQGCFVWDTLPTHSLWGEDKGVALESPELPSPLELLYGSSTNRLADVIHNNTRVWRSREPERLACGWVVYLLAKWMAAPSKPRFERLPEFLRPEPEQLRHPHPVCIDGIAIPQLRINLISKAHLYDLDLVLGMLSCCLKVRWPWGKNFLTRSGDAELCILPEFYNTFMSLEGWGLTEEFIKKYPELLEGLNSEDVCYKVV
ncbi:hypothetical protein BJX63DRAFT_223825 [Aspergillus granulosus]|uniref:BZIP domain-containing protein n=1 Tax=Aspergillus granulosus TaxID=176169 RepID=A0ABR4I3V4_9EURO